MADNADDAAVAPSGAAAPAASSSSSTLLTPDHLLAELPLQPPISVDQDGRPFYLCSYSGLPVHSSAAAFPEAVIRGRTPKDPTARLRGRFISYNAMLSWLVAHRPKLPADLYAFIKSWINMRAHEVNKQHGPDVALVPAPPAAWLQPDEHDVIPYTEQEWVDAHKGVIFLAGDIDPAVDKAMREAHVKDRQKKADQRKSAADAVAADAAARVSRIGEPESDDEESSTLSKSTKVSAAPAVSSAAAAPIKVMDAKAIDMDAVFAEMKARGYVFAQPSAPAAPPAAAAPKKKAAAKKASDDEKKPKEKKDKKPKQKSAKKLEEEEVAKNMLKSIADDEAAAAAKKKKPAAEAADADDEAKPAEPAKQRKRSSGSDDVEVKVPAGKRRAEPEVGSRLPRATRAMTYKLGAKVSGEVEATNFYSALAKAFVGSAKQFRAPDYVGILMCHRGVLTLKSLTSSASVAVPEVEMADAEL